MRTESSLKPRYLLILLLLVVAAISRLIPHPFNFTAIGAMALFSGAVIRDRRLAFLLPIVVMLLTDAFLGFHASMMPVYACFTFTVFLGVLMRNKQNPLTISACSIFSSVVFFLVTNLPFWYADISLYPLTWQGTLESYTAAIPFFGNQLAGDLFFNLLLFGSYYFLERRIPVMAEERN